MRKTNMVTEFDAGYESGLLHGEPIYGTLYPTLDKDSIRKALLGVKSDQTEIRMYWSGWLLGYYMKYHPLEGK